MTTASEAPHSNAPQAPQRKKYVFKKRDEAAAAKLEAERLANIKHNPFGNAKPREAVLAERTGKDEAELLKEEASTYEVHLRLTSEQFAEKKARQVEINELKSALTEGASGEQDTATLKETITQKEQELDDLVKGFEAMLVEKAKTGHLPRVDRKPFQNATGHTIPSVNAGSNNGGEYEAHQRPQRGHRGQFQPGAYEESSGDGGYNRRRGGRHPPRAGHMHGAGGGYSGGGYNDFPQHSGGYPHQDHVMAYPMAGPYGGYAGAPGPVFMPHTGYAMAPSTVDYHPIHER